MRKHQLTVAATLCAIAVVLTGCQWPPSAVPTPTAPPATAVPTPAAALALLDTLPVKGRAPKTGYSSAYDFWGMWGDPDANGCDARNDVLARDLTDVTYKENPLSARCLVKSDEKGWMARGRAFLERLSARDATTATGPA